MSSNSNPSPHDKAPDISRTAAVHNNLRTISMALVRKVRSSTAGIPSAQIANQLAQDAVLQVKGSLNHAEEEVVAVEKNIRRRLYDSLKVLMSIGAIRRTRKDKVLHWQGYSHLIPSTFLYSHSGPISPDRDLLSRSVLSMRKRIDEKSNALIQLSQQVSALEQLRHRNVTDAPNHQNANKIYMPFVVVRTPLATEIKLETTKDARSMSFQFSDTFEVVNDSSILDRLFCVDVNSEEKSTPNHPRGKQSALATPPRKSAHFRAAPSDLDYSNSSFPSPHISRSPVRSRQSPDHDDSLLRSPKRCRVTSAGVAPFAKYTSGMKPPLSPAPRLARRRKQRRMRHGGPSGSEAVRDLHNAVSSYKRETSMALLERLAQRSRDGASQAAASKTEPEVAKSEAEIAKLGLGIGKSELYFARPEENRQWEIPRPFPLEDISAHDGERRSRGCFVRRLYAPLRGDIEKCGNALGQEKKDTQVTFEREVALDSGGIELSPGLSPLPSLADGPAQGDSGDESVSKRLFDRK